MGSVIKRETGIEIEENYFNDNSPEEIIEKIRSMKQKCLTEGNNKNKKEEDLNNIDIDQSDMESDSNNENDKKIENDLDINTSVKKNLI